ncbi:MAG: hypothetical protein ABID09_03195 [Candidatus Omnitrophota bacterium]
MKNAGVFISVLGILVFVYAIGGRFIGSNTIGFGAARATATAGMVVANGIMLIGIIINLWGKE